MTESSPSTSPTHPVLAACTEIDAALKAVAWVEPTFMSTEEKASALASLVALEARLVELRLRILADAGDVAAQTGAADPASWLAHRTRMRIEDARADRALAVALDRRHPALREALRDGSVNSAQASVIARALDALPAEVGFEVRSRAETVLVGHAVTHGPRALHRLGARILDVVAPDVAEAAEARRLADLDRSAQRRQRLTLRRCGDGTTRIAGLLPDLVATRLATYLEAFTSPRQCHPLGLEDRESGVDPAGCGHEASAEPDPVARLPYPRRLAEAFAHLLECLDPTRLPLHGGDATTLVIALDLDTLVSGLGSGDVLIGSTIPGGDDGEDPAAGRISAAQVRRLACTAGLVPAVLGTDSTPLDLGRTARLFSPAQRRALLLRDRTCRAEGCTIPGTWTEAHHWLPWTRDQGPTDLANGVLLCRHHHGRAHGPDYVTDRLPNGDVRYTRRR